MHAVQNTAVVNTVEVKESDTVADSRSPEHRVSNLIHTKCMQTHFINIYGEMQPDLMELMSIEDKRKVIV